MRKLALLCGLLIAALPAMAQSTVTGTLTSASPDSQIYALGTYNFVLTGTGPFFVGGVQLTQAQINISGALNSSGAFSQSMYANTAITPSGSQWRMQFCPAASTNCYQTTVTISGSGSITGQLTPPAISVPAFSNVTVAAYKDSEITGQQNGTLYYNLTIPALRVYDAGSWSTVGGGGGLTCTASAGQILYSPAGTDCAGVPGFTSDANGAVSIAPTGTGVALSLTGDANSSDILELSSNIGPVINVNKEGGSLWNISDTNENQFFGVSVNFAETDGTADGDNNAAIIGAGALNGSNVSGDRVFGGSFRATDSSAGGVSPEATAVKGVATGGTNTALTTAFHATVAGSGAAGTNVGFLADDMPNATDFAIKTGVGIVSLGDALTAPNITDSALTASRCVQTSTGGLLAVAAGACQTATPTAIYSGGCASGVLSNLTNFCPVSGVNALSITEATAQVSGLVPRAITITAMYVQLSANVVAANTVVVTVDDNTSATAATCTVAAGTSTCNVTGLSVSVSVAHQLSAKVVGSTTAGTAAVAIGILYQ